MTKKDILEAVALDIHSLEQILDEFFESNICIPKGTNRHPDADVLHAIIENPFLKVETDQWALQWKEPESYYITNGIVNSKALIRYRIKPQEPEYEFQWLSIQNGKAKVSLDFLTVHEASLLENNIWIKIEETKRIRQ